jgi:formate-dependent nitrite reductase membrane component NrfD
MLAPLLVITGLLFLVAKLGRPLNMWQTMVHVAPTSPLWWGGIFQSMLVLGSLVYAALWFRPTDDNYGRRLVLGWVLAPVAAIVGVYHGMLLALTGARPLWNQGPTVVAAGLAFVATGISIVMLVHLVRMRVAGRLVEGPHLNEFLDDMRPVRNVLVAVLTIQIGTAVLWWIDLRFSSAGAQQALDAANATYGPLFWIGGIGLGLILPLLIGGYVTYRGARAGRLLQVYAVAGTSALILIGGFLFRLAVVLGGQVPLPAATLY